MNPQLAFWLTVGLVVWLLRVERQRNPSASLALWIPTAWLLIMGSRPVGAWFTSSGSVSDATGSFHDRVTLTVLMVLAIGVLARRKVNVSKALGANSALVLLYAFLLLSTLWSDYPYSCLKRWVRIAGAIPVAILIASESAPLRALESVLRRCAYVLVPFSLLLIKYFGGYGRAYDRWSGMQMWTGVTTHKNSLGILCAVSCSLVLWSLLNENLRSRLRQTPRQVCADIFVLGLASYLLRGPEGANSATSIVLTVVAVIVLLACRRWRRMGPWLVAHARSVLIAAAFIFLVLSTSVVSTVANWFGRDPSLSGRREIWDSVMEVASRHPAVGVGYESYWGLVPGSFERHHEVKQAHNGYLDVYLHVGVAGLALLLSFLNRLCGIITETINGQIEWGILGICMLIILMFYNYTESGFVVPNLVWTVTIFLAVTLVASQSSKDSVRPGFPDTAYWGACEGESK